MLYYFLADLEIGPDNKESYNQGIILYLRFEYILIFGLLGYKFTMIKLRFLTDIWMLFRITNPSLTFHT